MHRTINADTLRNSFLFKDVSAAVLQDVAAQCQPMALPAGETLFEQDALPDALYFLESGQIHVVRCYPDGSEFIIATEVPYYVIGELSLLANQPRTGSVVAVGDCDLIKLSREAIVDVCERVPQIAVTALTQLGNRLYRLNLLVRESALGNTAARLSSVMLLLVDEDKPTLEAPAITRLARATAVDANVVERLLKQWVDEGIITRQRKQITVRDLQALRNLAG